VVTRPSPAPPRLLNRDGSTNFVRVGLPERPFGDLHHYLLRSSWRKLFALIIAIYIGTNAVFAILYHLEGGVENAKSYLDHFFFSIHTMMTIGYGTMAPRSLFANFLVAAQALFGLMYAAMTTGIFFSKFSLPTARVMFSRAAIISSYNGVPSLMFRMANERHNQIVEASLNVTLARSETTLEGERMRRFYPLELQRNRSALFALSWTAIHPIDERSKLFGETPASMVEKRIEIIVAFVGIDETSSQTIHARHAYAPHEIYWDARFADIIQERDDGKSVVDYSKFHEVTRPRPP
jgi:inward rectifier potassium channel